VFFDLRQFCLINDVIEHGTLRVGQRRGDIKIPESFVQLIFRLCFPPPLARETVPFDERSTTAFPYLENRRHPDDGLDGPVVDRWYLWARCVAVPVFQLPRNRRTAPA
jgi:hypothetical protein